MYYNILDIIQSMHKFQLWTSSSPWWRNVPRLLNFIVSCMRRSEVGIGSARHVLFLAISIQTVLTLHISRITRGNLLCTQIASHNSIDINFIQYLTKMWCDRILYIIISIIIGHSYVIKSLSYTPKNNNTVCKTYKT